MQAIMETGFDIVYLATVLTLGIKMLRQCGDRAQFRLFGAMAVVLGGGRCLPSGPPGGGAVHHRAGKLHRGPGCGQMDHLHHHDGVLHSAVLRLAAAVSGAGTPGRHCAGMGAGGTAHRAVHDASEPLAQRRRAFELGHLAESALCSTGAGGHRALLPQRQRA